MLFLAVLDPAALALGVLLTAVIAEPEPADVILEAAADAMERDHPRPLHRL